MDYGIRAKDGKIGHLEDFRVHDRDWIIRYLIVDTLNFLPGREHEVVLLPGQVDKIEWIDRQLSVILTIDQIKNSPEYDPLTPLEFELEVIFHDYYAWPKYWEVFQV